MTDIGELVVRIKADAAQLEREMKRATGVVQQGATGMSSGFTRLKSEILSLAPAISAVGLIAFGKHAIDAAGHMVDLADRIGFASSTIAAMEIPLTASGSSLDEFASSINRMNNAIGEARNGNEAAIRAFDALGLSVDLLAKMSPEEQFYEIAGALGQIKDQSIQTEAGMNIFGRSFAAMLPLLKEYEGDMRKAIEAQKEMGNAISDETLKRIDQFGDSMSKAGLQIEHTFLKAFAAVLKVSDLINEVMEKPSPNAKWNLPGDNTPYIQGPNLPKGTMSTTRPRTVDYAVFGGGEQYGPAYKTPSASGSNAELLARVQSQKEATKATKEHAEATEKLTKANQELDRAAMEAAHRQAMFSDRISRGLTDLVFRANSARDVMRGLTESIARMVFEAKVAQPFADALIGKGGSTGLIGSLLPSFGGFFADGGSPPVGVPSIVGERGPEMFIPKSAGTVVPNHMLGGSTVIVQQTIQVNPGVPELVGAKIQESAPAIAALAKAEVFAAMQRGGTASKITGLRN